MKNVFALISLLIFGSSIIQSQSQLNRIKYNNQDLFLNGVNIAWINFANDLGPGETNYDSFADLFLTLHDNGGNAVRWWLHTNGTSSPSFNAQGYVNGPGSGTIQDLKKVLDLAWQREIGVKLCLWSFDMLRSNLNSTALNRNILMLSDTSYANAYIRNCLIPMVDSLKEHPAIIAWEIFNEPEGMSNEFGWSDIKHVPMSYIQRFVNLCAGAIHRIDPKALVTNGSWSFQASTDVTPLAKFSVDQYYNSLTEEDKNIIEKEFEQKYSMKYSARKIIEAFTGMNAANYNYYRDDRLIASGGDPDGKLDFYSVHYYDWDGAKHSPFQKSASTWQLDKPLLLAEFHMKNTLGVPMNKLYEILYGAGYAGALAWSWTDNATSQKADMIAGVKSIWDKYKSDVDVNGIAGDFPTITLTSPSNGGKYPSGIELTLSAEANDTDGTVVLVEFFNNNTVKIGEVANAPYSILWKPANGEYKLTAVAKDDRGNQRISSLVQITIGTPTFTKFEAEAAAKSGTGVTVKSDITASGRAYVDLATNSGKISWTIPNVNSAGNYEIKFGAKLNYDSPKTQYINVNGTRVGSLEFKGPANLWTEYPYSVDLIQGKNTIEMEAFWGWMFVDYVSLPTEIVTSIESETELPTEFALMQNYPNPFNPETTISYVIPSGVRNLKDFSQTSSPRNDNVNVTLKVFDVLGREVATLVDEIQRPGFYNVKFSLTSSLSAHNSTLSSAIYFYRLQAGDFMQTKKMILMK